MSRAAQVAGALVVVLHRPLHQKQYACHGISNPEIHFSKISDLQVAKQQNEPMICVAQKIIMISLDIVAHSSSSSVSQVPARLSFLQAPRGIG